MRMIQAKHIVSISKSHAKESSLGLLERGECVVRYRGDPIHQHHWSYTPFSALRRKLEPGFLYIRGRGYDHLLNTMDIVAVEPSGAGAVILMSNGLYHEVEKKTVKQVFKMVYNSQCQPLNQWLDLDDTETAQAVRLED